MRNWSVLITKKSTGRLALTGLVIFLAFMAFVLPGQAEKAAEYSAGVGSPDQSFFYSASDLYEMAEGYGESGREAYIRARWTFDVIFPIVYTLFLTTSIAWVFKKAFAPGSQWHLLNLFPVLGMMFDYLENTGASIVLARFPQQTPVVADITPLLSLIKWFFVNGSFVVLLVGVVIAAFKVLARPR